jgi:hypothetical protein
LASVTVARCTFDFIMRRRIVSSLVVDAAGAVAPWFASILAGAARDLPTVGG